MKKTDVGNREVNENITRTIVSITAVANEHKEKKRKVRAALLRDAVAPFVLRCPPILND